jgi:hypothetical protein
LEKLLLPEELREDAGFRRFCSSRKVRSGITTSGRDCDENAAFLFPFPSCQIFGQHIYYCVSPQDIKTTSYKTSP